MMKKFMPCVLMMILLGCKKSDETAPVVTLISPTENQTFTSGQTVTVKATITDDTGIHMVHLIVTDNTGGHLVHFEEHFDGKNYDLNNSFSTQSGRTYSIHIDAVDHSDNVTNKDFTVSSN